MANPGNLDDVSQIIAIHSAKGGVGKSTVAVNMAAALARKGARVGLLDADVHGPSDSMMLGNSDWPDPSGKPNTILPLRAHGIKFVSMGNLVTEQTPVMWRGAMVHGVINQFLTDVDWGKLDFLLIDMPPGTGDAQLSIAQGVPLAGAVVVSTPQELSLVDTLRGINCFRKLNVPILGLIENMSYFVCDGCQQREHLFGESGAQALADEMSFQVLARIPIEPLICESGDKGKPFVLSAPDSASARAVESGLGELLSILDKSKSTYSFKLDWAEMGWDQRQPTPPASEETVGPVKAIWQVSQDELGIQWSDDKTSTVSVRELRLACPCAACVDEWTAQALLDPDKVPADVTLQKIFSVGRYAIQPEFSDGHKSGIFHFDRLRDLTER